MIGYFVHDHGSFRAMVACWSSRLPEAKSELIVPGPHGSHELEYHVGETWAGKLLELGPLCTRIFTAWLSCSTFSGFFRTVTGLI